MRLVSKQLPIVKLVMLTENYHQHVLVLMDTMNWIMNVTNVIGDVQHVLPLIVKHVLMKTDCYQTVIVMPDIMKLKEKYANLVQINVQHVSTPQTSVHFVPQQENLVLNQTAHAQMDNMLMKTEFVKHVTILV